MIFDKLLSRGLMIEAEGATGAGAAGGAAPVLAEPAVEPEVGGAALSNEDNIRTLRQNYEQQKNSLDSYTRLGRPEEIRGRIDILGRIEGEGARLAEELQFEAQEFREAFNEDPLGTLDFLRKAAQEKAPALQGQPDLNRLVKEAVGKELGPIREQENIRRTDAANAVFDQEVHNLAAAEFKAAGIDIGAVDSGEMELITNAVSEIFKYDEEGMTALKMEGKTASIKKAFTEARTMLDKYYLARQKRENSKLGLTGQQRSGQADRKGGKKRPTLDEIIDNPAVLGQKYA